MSSYTFTIQGTLAGLNEFINAERTHRQKGAKLKKDTENVVRYMIRNQLRGIEPKTPVFLHYRFFEPNRRRDKDNICGFAHKVIQDALVKEGILKNDGWDYISGFMDTFDIDKEMPRIEVTIIEPQDQ